MMTCTLKSTTHPTLRRQRHIEAVGAVQLALEAESIPPRPSQARFGPQGRYEFGERLGAGGAGVVYLVYDRKLDRQVAGKLLRSDTLDARPLYREARAMARLNHQHVVCLYDYQLVDDRPCLLMEYVEGRTLEQLLDAGPLPLCQALQLAREVVVGLEHAHSIGVLHLDLKPGNIWVTDTGHAKLMDFGVGSELPPFGEFPTGTPRDTVIGTPQYMAPEQWSLGELDARTDVWAFGVVLYEMVFGCLPFGRHPSYLTTLHENGAKLRMKYPVPSSVARVLQRALGSLPDDRFQESTALRVAVERACRDASLAQSRELLPLENRMAAALHLLGPAFDADEVARVSGASPVATRKILARLQALGVVRPRRDDAGRYVIVNPLLATTCFFRLSAAEQGELQQAAEQHAREP